MARDALGARETGSLPVTYADVESAHARISAHAIRTPVMTSSTVDARTGAQVFFKCENFQRMGAFKFRGALNAMSQLSAEDARRGVISYSSGNHAQAVALAGRLLGIRTTIVMPADAPQATAPRSSLTMRRPPRANPSRAVSRPSAA
jgi:threonine dehydratase